ncbi:acyl-CoA dehydrogenase family protein [Gulosibacter molinativorax]|uniref:Acyl-CoA dehydrogenase n=1 Tax=Gulosibacter molinativorax TaxID=256821 RepID=A0ABT7CBE4_9MICO|nr:acyl-CoA dehydrogenase family protein [Gulosibacter molinativorax]MDJ1372475.1 acyl-CoA dehydrogenase [Gulosibacter molinativorax]QUY61948.1 (R)-benzylsuccinyl-CoA dehydrogenase [Gulosibacter molinativorax]
MDFALDDKTKALAEVAKRFLHEEVIPAEPQHAADLRDAENPWRRTPTARRLAARARELGLWNLFLPGEDGAGLTQLQYATIAEISGWSPNLMPQAMNCAAPDSGNMEMLRDFASPEAKDRWLKPLLDGEIRSAFCMTEPAVASSDARNIQASMIRDGDEYLINGRKWFTSGAMNPESEIFIVMGKSDPTGEPHRQQSMILVPRDTPGVTILRPLTVFGYLDHDHGGHAEVDFVDVRVPVTNILKGEGEGFAISQARLGPGRIHHCMRLLGMAERALDLVGHRAWERSAFGKPLAKQGTVREFVANARITIESLRLLTLKTAWLMDTVGNRAAHTEIQAIKIAVPREVQAIIDDAIQLFGGAGLSQDTPLAELFAAARGLRLADGPDAAHIASLGRNELRRFEPSEAV